MAVHERPFGSLLRKEETLLGVFVIYRQEVRPFTDKQIALLQNFAAQAVIAMENARLITETREALEQQTATAEVLQVINASPGDLAPVFDAMLDKAMRLCGAAFGALMSYDGERARAVSMRGFPPELARLYANPIVPRRDGDSPYARFLRGEPLLHIHDMAADEVRASLASRPRALVELGGARTGLELPLRKDGALLGSMGSTARKSARSPTADRPLTEFRGAGGDRDGERAAPDRDARGVGAADRDRRGAGGHQLLARRPRAGLRGHTWKKHISLCDAASAAFLAYDGEHVSCGGDTENVQTDYAKSCAKSGGRAPDRAARVDQLAAERAVSISSTSAALPMLPPGWPVGSSSWSTRAAPERPWSLCVKKERCSAFMVLYRQEVRPFTDKQIALLQNFAAQAAIAMENARLITETREALEQQTATAEVLQVINSSPGDLAPVFEAMLDKATHLCECRLWTASGRLDGGHFARSQRTGCPSDRRVCSSGSSLIAGTRFPFERLLNGDPFVHITDHQIRRSPSFFVRVREASGPAESARGCFSACAKTNTPRR